MSNEAEQSEELEVLASIFPEEFQVLEDGHSFKLLLKPNTDGGDNHVIVSLLGEFPPTYPTESPPTLKVQVVKGLSATQGDEVKELADRVALENLGAPSIFAVAEAVKEWLVDNNIAGQDGSMYSEMMRRMQQKDLQQKKQTEKAAISAAADSEFKEKIVDPEELERIRKRQEGTAVTVDTFNKWKKAFDDEMAAKELEALRNGTGNANNLAPLVAVSVGESGENMKALLETLAADGRPTGKQYFLLNMGGTKGTGEGGEDPDADLDDGPDAFSEALAAGIGARARGEGEEDSDEDDSDYVDEGEEDEDDDDDADFEDEDEA